MWLKYCSIYSIKHFSMFRFLLFRLLFVTVFDFYCFDVRFELRISCIQSGSLTHDYSCGHWNVRSKINLEHNTIAVSVFNCHGVFIQINS